MKYLLIALVVIIAAFGFMAKHNKTKSQEIAAQAEAYKQKRESEKQAELEKQYIASGIDQYKASQMARDSASAISSVNADRSASDAQRAEIANNKDAFNNILREWADAETVASRTSRINLSQPVSNMQAIKRKVEDFKAIGCMTPTKELYSKAMGATIDSFLTFMMGKDHELEATSKTLEAATFMNEAKNSFTYCS